MLVVLDIETELLSEKFQNAGSTFARLRHAPNPRLACVYIERKKKYQFFTPDMFSKLLGLLRRAKEIITYNGERFDFLVIKKHLGIRGKLFPKNKSVDLFKVMKRRADFRVSLDAAARLNLGQPKRFKGSILATAPMTVLKKGCQSDVKQTYLLWKKYKGGTLMVPGKTEQSHWERFDDYEPRIVTCPKCGQTPSPDWEHMSEGEMAEYIAWTLGGGFCPFCEHPTS